MRSGLYFEDIAEGDVFTSAGRTVTEADLVNFAGLSGDFNPIHMDATLTQEGEFGQRLVHGILGVAMVTGMLDGMGLFRGTMIAMLAIEDWRFTGPIFVGDTLHIRMTLDSKRRTSRGDRGILRRRIELIKQDDTVVQEGIITVMIRCREAAESGSEA